MVKSSNFCAKVSKKWQCKIFHFPVFIGYSLCDRHASPTYSSERDILIFCLNSFLNRCSVKLCVILSCIISVTSHTRPPNIFILFCSYFLTFYFSSYFSRIIPGIRYVGFLSCHCHACLLSTATICFLTAQSISNKPVNDQNNGAKRIN